ncbi:MAG: transcriptional regulator NrdR [Thiohalomonadales bacterium]
MHCPFCETEETKVIDSRLANEGSAVRRRRECLICKERFTTFEKAEMLMPQIVKHDGRREVFNEDKLKLGIERSLEKRPIKSEVIDLAINRILKHIRACGEREVQSRLLGELAMNELRDIDQVAYVRYASVYRSFEDVHAFKEEIDRLEKTPTAELKELQTTLLDEQTPKK